MNNRTDAREAYIDEVHTAVGLPLFLEGPADPSTFNGWSVNIQGIPRYLCNQGGILRFTFHLKCRTLFQVFTFLYFLIFSGKIWTQKI